MKHGLGLLILVAALALPASSQSLPTERIQKITKNIRQFDSWQISLLREDQWQSLRAKGGGHSQVATTNLNEKITFVRASFVNNSDDRLVRRILLHEAGHIQCHCTFETVAEQFAVEHE